MYTKKIFRKLIAASVMVSSLTFMPNFDCAGVQIISSVAYAEVQTYTGVGDYVLSDDVPPGDIKAKAKLYAQRNALEQAGIFVSSLTEVKNGIVTKDEIITIAGSILKIVDTKYEVIPINDNSGIAKYRATVTAQIDTDTLKDEINKFLNRDNQERLKLVEQNKALQKTIDEQAKRIKELENSASKAKTSQDIQTVNEEIKNIDKNTLAIQKLEEGYKAIEQNDLNSAILFCTEAIQLDANQAGAYFTRSIAYYELRNYNQVVADMNKAIQINPNIAQAYWIRGSSYRMLNKYNQAIADMNKAIQINPNFAEAYNERGNVYVILKNFSQAVTDLNKAIQLNPNLADAYRNRGIVHTLLGNHHQAMADLNRAIQLCSKLIDSESLAATYYMRGILYQEMGNNYKAQVDFAKAKELGYTG